LELIADDSPAERSESTADRRSGGGVTGRVPDQRAGAGAERPAAEGSFLSLRQRAGCAADHENAHEYRSNEWQSHG
jgi:hypothetical protein